MRVVVIGGGYGGLASAVRLAKLGHQVSLLESADRVGGALRPLPDHDGWDVVGATLLPAPMRDLFRKSGRPIERELELEPVPVIREHRFEDRSAVRLPGESRAAQIEAFDELKPGLGEAWAHHVEAYGEVWELLRQHLFEARTAEPPREVLRLLSDRETLARRVRHDFKDPRQRLVATLPFEAAGHNPRDVPWWAGVSAYLEQRFGAWRVVGGPEALAEALAERLATRRVAVHTSTDARDIVVRDRRAVAVSTDDGEIDADAVVVAVDPRRLPALAGLAARTLPAIPPTIVLLQLDDPPALDLPDGADLVLHGDPLFVIRPQGDRWTVLVRGALLEDIDMALLRRKLDLRGKIVDQVQLSPATLVGHWGGSPLGVAWQGRGSIRDRIGPHTPIPGVYAAGAHAISGDGLPFVGLSAALVAQAIGPA